MTQNKKRGISLSDWEFTDDEILSIKEAAFFADLFDDIGEYHNANLMDEYIQKMGTAQDDIIKQAGLFRNLLRKLVGFGKRIFFNVYRELYAKAKEAQARLDDRVDEINEAYKNIKKDLKYHDLEGWRGGIFAMNLGDSKEIMGDFDIAYGKLVRYLGLTGESEKGKEEVKKPKDLSQIEKLPDVGGPSEETLPEEGGPAGSWERQTPGAKEGWSEIARSVAFNPSQGALRIDRKYFDYLLGKHLSTDGAGNVKYWSSYGEQKQPMQGKLKDMMGDSAWKMKEDKNFVYLYPLERGSDTGAPPVQPKEDEKTYEAEFESPEFPKEDEKVYPLTRRKKRPEETSEEPEEAPEEVPEEPEETPEEVEETPEEVEETPEEPEETPEEPGEEVEEEVPEGAVLEEEPEETEERSPKSLVQRQSPRQAIWVERTRPERKKDGELWSRFTKVYPSTARRYEKQGKGNVLQDPDLISFLDKAVPQQFPGHSTNVTKVWLPSDLERRKQYVEMAERNWAAKKKAESRLDIIQELYKMAMREKWQK
jgi:hypothetical protein